MQDRLTLTPGRVLITPESGEPYYAVVTMADNPIVDGSDYNKENVSPDEVCDLYGVDRVTSEPKDLFLAVPALMGKAILTVNVLKPNSTAFPNLVVDGLGLDSALTTTNASGTFTVLVDAGTYTLTSTALNATFDTAFPSTAVTIAKGEEKTVNVTTTANGTNNKRSITASSTVKFSSAVSGIDVFCVGAGSGGGRGSDGSYSAGGGGGGYTATGLGVLPTAWASYAAIIGAGGTGQTSSAAATAGGATSLLGVSANGGSAASGRTAGSGGSGGGGGGSTTYTYNGGADGSDGGGTTYKGVGQGTTTREFGEASGTAYSGGGGCGGSLDGGGAGGAGGGIANSISGHDGANASANTGGGGGGGAKDPGDGGAGGSGVIVVRWRYS